MVFPFLAGLALTIALLIVSIWTGLAREKGVYPITLIAIALFYVVFAIEWGNNNQIFLNAVIAGLFMLIAIVGYRISFTLIAFGLVLHGVFDLLYAFMGSSPAPHWWAPFCLAVDVLLGLFLFFMIAKKRIA